MIQPFRSTSAAMAGIALALLAFVMPAAPASATTVSDCQAQLATLIGQTQAASFLGKNATTDQANLVAKLVAAQSKLTQGKFSDAIGKLNDFVGRVNQLDAQGKLSHGDAGPLVSGAQGAILCIQQIS